MRNQLKRGMPEPGDNDKALIALACRTGAPLFTHDGPAAALANRCEVLVVDAIDLGGFFSRVGMVDPVRMEAMLAPLGLHAWRPPSWAGDVASTVAGRPKWEALAVRLTAWWGP